MSAAGSVSVQITADVASFQRAIDQAERDVSKFAGSAGRSASEVEGAMRRAGVSMSGLRFDAQGRLRNEMGQYATAAERARFATERLGASANDNFRRMATGATAAHNAINGLQAGAMRLAAALGGLAAARSIGGGFVAMTDEATRLDGRLRLVTQSSEELARVNRDLFDISQRTRSEFAGNVELYTRSAQALREMGASSAQILTLTESLNQAFVISGATTAEQSAAIVQLSQAFASGVLRGEEFNSVSEQGPRIMQALADALGKTRGELRKLAEDGQLTSDVVFRALLSQAPKIADEFERVPRTVSQAMVQLRNDMLSAVAGVNQTEGATAALVAEIDRLRSAVNDTNFASGVTLAVREIATVTEQIREAAADVARIYDAVGTAYEQVGETISGFVSQVTLSQSAAGDLSDAWFGAMRELREHVGGAVLDAVERLSAIPSAGVAAYETFVGAWEKLPAALGGIITEAAARTIEGVESMVDGAIDILNRIPGVEIENIAGAISSRFRAAVAPGGEQAGDDFVQKFWSKFDENQSAVRGRASAFGQSVAEELGFRSREAQQIVDGYNVIKDWAGQAADAVRGYFAGSGEVAVAATGPTIALGEATEDTAKSLKKLASEADRLVERHFPFEAATAEAQRLLAAVNDNTNGLTDMQRAALRLEADDVFRRLEDGAGKTSAALREMQSAASSAVDRFFPFEAAAREAERLNAIIADTTNGLSDLDRRALQLQIDQGFIDAAEAAERLRTGGKKAAEDIGQSFIENVGNVFADIFSSATRDGESFFASILRGFAGLGSQLAAAGAKNLLGQALGIDFGDKAKSAAGIGGLIGQAGGIASSYASASAGVPTPTQRPEFVGQAAAAVSGQVLQYAGRFNKAVDGRLMTILETAAKNFPMRVEAISGLRPGDPRFHGKGLAADVQIYGADGRAFDNYQNARDFRVYEQFAQQAKIAQEKLFPELGKLFRWGGYFSGGKGKYGALDSMHFDLGGAGMGGGSWENGLTPAMRRLWAGVQSQGMGSGSTRATDGILTASTREYQRATARGVQDGLASYAGGPMPSPAAQTAMAGGFDGVVPQRMPFGQTAMGVVGAGLGIFGQGYQSANPLMGGVSGALGGFQAGAALFPALGAAGPVGAAIGAAVGLLGGALGKRAEREKQHRDAAAAWEQARPQYEEFKRSLTGETQGQLRQFIEGSMSQLSGFMATGGKAWKYGQGNSTAEFFSTGQAIWKEFHKRIDEYRAGFESLNETMRRGGTTQSEYAKGLSAAKEMKAQIDAFLDDTAIAYMKADFSFGSNESALEAEKAHEEMRNAALEKARASSVEYALAMLYTADTMSEVEKTIDGLRGAALGVSGILQDLGLTAEETGRRVEERLVEALRDVAKGLEQGVSDRIADLNGTGYTVQVRQFLEEYETLQKDFKAAGADTSQLPDLFRRQLQAIVDGAELTGTAFTDLIAQFPALSSVVTEFTETAIAASATEIRDAIKGYQERLFQAQHAGDEIALFDRRAAQERVDAARFGADALAALEAALGAERANVLKTTVEATRKQAQDLASGRMEQAIRARSEAESALRQEYERTVSFVDGIKGFLDSVRLNRDVSTLNNAERLAEAEKQYRETLALANGGDQEAQDRLVSSSEAYLREARDYYATSEAYGKIYDEINASLKDTVAKAETELDVARRQASFLGEIANGQKGLTVLMNEYLAAVQEVMKSLALVNQNRDWGANASFNRSLVDALSKAGITYGGNFGNGQYQSWLNTLSAADRAKAESIGAGLSGSRPAVAAPTRDWGVNAAANQGYVNALAGVGLNYGGAFGSGGFQAYLNALSAVERERARGVLGFQSGGYTGGTSPSEVRGIVHGMEGVLTASAMRGIGVPALNYMNANRRLPEVAMPRPFSSSNDNGASIVAAIERLSARVEDVAKRQTSAVLTSGKGTQDAIRETGDSNNRRNRANDRMAERRAEVATKAA